MALSLDQRFAALQSFLVAVGAKDDAKSLQSIFSIRQQSTLRIVVFGQFSSGKSTLINSLLGVGREVLVRHLLPTTGHITRVVYGDPEEVRVWNKDGELETYDLSHLDTLSTLDDNGKAREGIELIEVAVNSPLLKTGIVLVDTPGINDRPEQTIRAKEAIRQADVVIFMLNAKQLMTSEERELSAIWLGQKLRKPVVPVVNFLNLFSDEEDQQEVKIFMDAWCQRNLQKVLSKSWLSIDAKSALLYTLGKLPLPSDDFSLLREWLTEYGEERRSHLQIKSRTNQLLFDLEEVRTTNTQKLAMLRIESAKTIETLRAEEREKLRSTLGVLESEATRLKAVLTQESSAALNAKLERLTNYWFAGESKQRLEDNAGRWYAEMLQEAASEIDVLGNNHLASLGVCALSQNLAQPMQPTPMTVVERLIILSRLKVSTLAAVSDEDVVFAGKVIGGIIGQFAIPVPFLGAIAGATVGGLIGTLLGKREPDYVAAYSAQSRTHWAIDADRILDTMQAQFEIRVDELKLLIRNRIDSVNISLPPSEELMQRERIDQGLRDLIDILEGSKANWSRLTNLGHNGSKLPFMYLDGNYVTPSTSELAKLWPPPPGRRRRK